MYSSWLLILFLPRKLPRMFTHGSAGGAASPEALSGWVGARLAAHETALAALKNLPWKARGRWRTRCDFTMRRWSN